jgi:hypothetical protein
LRRSRPRAGGGWTTCSNRCCIGRSGASCDGTGGLDPEPQATQVAATQGKACLRRLGMKEKRGAGGGAWQRTRACASRGRSALLYGPALMPSRRRSASLCVAASPLARAGLRKAKPACAGSDRAARSRGGGARGRAGWRAVEEEVRKAKPACTGLERKKKGAPAEVHGNAPECAPQEVCPPSCTDRLSCQADDGRLRSA